MKLSKIGEFGLINDVIAPEFKTLVKKNFQGIGDDCSIIPVNEKVSHIFTTDMLVEKTHFLRDKITPYQLGFKSLAVNLSDIAAMGGKPTASYLSVGFPEDIEVEWVEEFLKGYKSLSEKENVPLLGGDTTGSKNEIVINVGVEGEIETSRLKYRSSAKKDDIICVSGFLGDSSAGLQCILNNIPENASTKRLYDQHLTPYPHVAEGQWLAQFNSVHAMIDVSDGIGSDLKHILKASGKAAVVEIESIPISEELKDVCRNNDWNPYELAVSGGEDYVLLFTVDPREYDKLAESFQQFFSKPIYPIGMIAEGKPKIQFRNYGKENPDLNKGYSHFFEK
ncbi:MAG: thiamine-phosphate kinase [Bacteroidales bacterium]